MTKYTDTPRGSVIIRHSRVADAAQFRELRLGALQDSPTAFSMDHEKAANQPIKHWEDMLIMHDAESAIFFAEYHGALIGMTGIVQGRTPKTRHNAEVWGVYVVSEWRGMHVAEEMIRSGLEWAKARNVITVRLEVTTINEPALRCYQRCGFTIYAIESRALFHEGRYYDFYRMSLTLEE